MKFKKVIIDGKTYYEEDPNGTYEKDINEEVVDVDDDTTFNEKVKRYINRIDEKMKNLGSKINEECKDLASQIREATAKFKKNINKAKDEEELEAVYTLIMDELYEEEEN